MGKSIKQSESPDLLHDCELQVFIDRRAKVRARRGFFFMALAVTVPVSLMGLANLSNLILFNIVAYLIYPAIVVLCIWNLLIDLPPICRVCGVRMKRELKGSRKHPSYRSIFFVCPECKRYVDSQKEIS